MKKVVPVEAATTTYTYSLLWHAAQNSLEQSEAVNGTSLYNRISAVVLSAFAVEAYLNHVGILKIASWELVERKLSPEEKIRFLENELSFSVDFGRTPFNSFKSLFKFRNDMAHGRTERVTHVIEVPVGQEDADHCPPSTVTVTCSPQKARRFVEDAKAMIEELNKLAKVNDGWWLWNMFEGESMVGAPKEGG